MIHSITLIVEGERLGETKRKKGNRKEDNRNLKIEEES